MAKQSVGAIWRKQTKNGQDFLSITIGEQKYVAYLNDYKKEAKQPDFKIFVDEWKPGTKATQTETPKNETNDLPF
jgi:uncharacterized protein (DUF736 family)